MLYRVHGNSRPRPNIHIAVVKRMNMAVQHPGVKKPVSPVEMKGDPRAGEDQDHDEEQRQEDCVCMHGHLYFITGMGTQPAPRKYTRNAIVLRLMP